MTDYRIELGDSRERLIRHPIYGLVDTPERMRLFMQTHIWAVWDFQSLLKSVQQQLSCVTVPWVPTPDPEARRLINEIVLDLHGGIEIIFLERLTELGESILEAILFRFKCGGGLGDLLLVLHLCFLIIVRNSINVLDFDSM